MSAAASPRASSSAQRVAARNGLPGLRLGGHPGRLGGCELGSRGGLGRCRGRRLGRSGGRLGVGLAGCALVGRERGRQPVALGPGGHPRRLARVGRAPQLSALGVDPRALLGDGDSMLDRAQVVDEPDAVDEPGGSGVADVGHLAERAGAGRRRQRRLERPRLAQDDGDLALGPPEEVERVLDPFGHDRAGAPAERRRDGPLEPRMRLDAGSDEVGAGRLEGPRCRREPLAAVDRGVERVDAGAVDVEPARGVGRGRPRVALGNRSGVGSDPRLGCGAVALADGRLRRRDGRRRLLGGLLGACERRASLLTGRLKLVDPRLELARAAGRRLGLAPCRGRLALGVGQAAAGLHHRTQGRLGRGRGLGGFTRVRRRRARAPRAPRSRPLRRPGRARPRAA